MDLVSKQKLPKSNILRYDNSVCTGCKVCELVCSFYHEKIFSQSLARLHIFNDIFYGKNRANLCLQCDDPQCYYACPVSAIIIDENTGARLIDNSLCTGCGSCAQECPYNKEGHVIKQHENENIYYKCDLCGGDPKCVEWCPTGALAYITNFGDE